MYWPSLQGLIFKGKTHQLMALLNYLIWKDNGLYYLQSWLQEKSSSSNILYLFTIRSKLHFFFSTKGEVLGFFLFWNFFLVLSLPVNIDQNYFMVTLVSAVSNEVSILLCFFLIHTVAERKYLIESLDFQAKR